MSILFIRFLNLFRYKLPNAFGGGLYSYHYLPRGHNLPRSGNNPLWQGAVEIPQNDSHRAAKTQVDRNVVTNTH